MATVYKQGKKGIISLVGWAPKDIRLRLKVDWKKLGLDPKNMKMDAPAIKDS